MVPGAYWPLTLLAAARTRPRTDPPTLARSCCRISSICPEIRLTWPAEPLAGGPDPLELPPCSGELEAQLLGLAAGLGGLLARDSQLLLLRDGRAVELDSVALWKPSCGQAGQPERLDELRMLGRDVEPREPVEQGERVARGKQASGSQEAGNRVLELGSVASTTTTQGRQRARSIVRRSLLLGALDVDLQEVDRVDHEEAAGEYVVEPSGRRR